MEDFHNSCDTRDINLKPWLLIQFHLDETSVCHRIINRKETIWKNKNSHPNVVAYLLKNNTVYQGIILVKSEDSQLLESHLQRISDSYKTLMTSVSIKFYSNLNSFSKTFLISDRFPLL